MKKKSYLWFFVALFVACICAGCGDDSGSDTTGPTLCVTAQDCPLGQQCALGNCVVGGVSNSGDAGEDASDEDSGEDGGEDDVGGDVADDVAMEDVGDEDTEASDGGDDVSEDTDDPMDTNDDMDTAVDVPNEDTGPTFVGIGEACDNEGLLCATNVSPQLECVRPLFGATQLVCAPVCRQSACPMEASCCEPSEVVETSEQSFHCVDVPEPDACTNGVVACEGDGECGFGMRCVGGFCQIAQCLSPFDCPDGSFCNEQGICAIGELPCSGDGDCQFGLEFCDLMSGACVIIGGCRDDGDCGGDQWCDREGICRERLGCEFGIDCVEGQICDPVLDECRQACARDEHCREGQLCEFSTGECQPLGEFCRTRADCTLYERCNLQPAPLVLRTCETAGFCLSDDNCREDEWCAQFENLCVVANRPCDSNDDCLVGSEFCDLEQMLCQPGCLDDSQCGANERCNMETNTCIDDSLCISNADCDPGMFCSLATRACIDEFSCGGDVDCEPGFRCSQQMCVEAGRCTNDGDCDPGFECDVATGMCNEAGMCTGDGDCDPGFTCDVASGMCVEAGMCMNDGDCDPGFECVMGECVEESMGCMSDEDCADGERCDTNTQMCVEGEIPCEEDTDCQPGFVCSADDGFVCVREQACQPGECPVGEGCDRVQRLCIVGGSECDADDDCPSAFPRCDTDSELCLEACVNDLSCDTNLGEICNIQTGRCELPNMEQCDDDEDCGPDETCNLASGECE